MRPNMIRTLHGFASGRIVSGPAEAIASGGRGAAHVCADGRDRRPQGAGRRRDVARGASVPGACRRRCQGGAEGLDAGGVSQDARAADPAACALGDRRDVARGQLGDARADAQAQGHPDGQDPGRGGARPLPLLGGRDAGRLARRSGARPARRQGQVFVDLQLSHADLGRHRCDRLARRRRGDHEPDPVVPLQLRPLCAR